MSSFSLLRSFSSEASQSTPPKRRINKRFSFHQKHHQSVKDPIESGSMECDKKMKTHLNRRWSSLKQYRKYTQSIETTIAFLLPIEWNRYCLQKRRRCRSNLLQQVNRTRVPLRRASEIRYCRRVYPVRAMWKRSGRSLSITESQWVVVKQSAAACWR